MSLSASAVILLTALLRRLAANRLPRRMYIALWDIALLANMVPFRVPWEALSRLTRQVKETFSQADAVFSVPSTMPQLAQNVSVTMPQVVTEALPIAAPTVVTNSVRDSLTQAVQPLRETVRSAPDWLWQAVAALWMIGAVVLAAVLAYRWLSCRRVFSEALPCGDQRAAAFLKEHRLLRRVQVRVSERIASPLSYGLLRPVILLPASMANADDQTVRYVLTHEFMHIRAYDMLRKSALLLALCLHWFNPLAWVMLRLCNRDMELMCDERVVRHLGGRKAYCLTLLDMEVRRSNLTMGTCFSVTGIEERINVMKNRKQQSILSIVLAFAIFLGATVGAMTGLPLADAEETSPRMIFSRETWEGTYAKYEPYGLGYDGKNGTITYNGQVVRYFEDMWPIDETSKSGACFIYEGGTVDVYGVREFPETIHRNPDGTFDPSGVLMGLRQATQEEYDALTEWLKSGSVSQITYAMAGTTPMNDDPDATPGPIAYTKLDPESPFAYDHPTESVQWWTAEEYRAWMEEERAVIQQLVDELARAWTPSRGWFVWTQAEADAAMARYESTLQAIEQGAYVSKPDSNGDVFFFSSVSEINIPANAPSIGSVSEDEAWTHMSTDYAQSVGFSLEPASRETHTIIIFAPIDPEEEWQYTPEQWAVIQELVDQGATQWLSPTVGRVIHVAVAPKDEWRYTPEQWAVIQELVDQGATRYLGATNGLAGMTDQTYQIARRESWRKAIEPYEPFGIYFVQETVTDSFRLYWNGRQIRGIFDPERGVWVTDSTGNVGYPEGAKELIAVYENGELVGLREANAEESAIWDNLRGGNE